MRIDYFIGQNNWKVVNSKYIYLYKQNYNDKLMGLKPDFYKQHNHKHRH